MNKPTHRLLATALALSAIGLCHAKPTVWLTSYAEAIKASKKTGKPILANFTGSDWCGWCIQLDHEVFNTSSFQKWAAEKVVLLELDFPRHKALPKALAQQNDELQRKYGPEGFPMIYFLDSDGKAFGKYHYDKGGPAHWTQMADRLLKGKTVAQRPLRFASKSDGYPAKVEKNLYATNDFRGKKAPTLKVEQWLSGPAPNTAGKVVLVDFWATWCPSCVELIPELVTWQKKFKNDLVVIGISDEDAAKVRAFAKKKGMTYNLGIDPAQRTMKVIDIAAIPQVLVITPDHVVRWQGFPGDEADKLTDKKLAQIIETSKKQAAGAGPKH